MTSERTRIALAWAVPPAAWFVTLEANYLLARWVCATGERWVLSAIALLASAAIVLSALPTAPSATDLGTDPEQPMTTRRFLVLAGLLLAAASLLGVAALAVPGFIHRPCD